MRLILVRGDVQAADREARWIIEAATGNDRAALTDSRSIDEGQAAIAMSLAERRASGEPLQYLTGVSGFRRLELAVGPGVLIPRPETEIVAEQAMDKLPRGGVVVDCGTGSGAIALSISQERPDACVLATERSRAALLWAQKNRDALGLEVQLIECDLLEGLSRGLPCEIDVIVSNPPYVALADRDALPRDVLEYEPPEALFAGDDGLEAIVRLASEAFRWLKPGGWLVTEIGEGQASAVRNLLETRGYDEVAIRNDLTGRPRIASGRRPL